MYEMTAKEVEIALDNNEDIHLIDVREIDEVESGHIPGITHIPLGSIPEYIDNLKPQTTYIIVCRSGARSANATAYLRQYDIDAYNMVGGMLAWEGEVQY